MPAPERFGIEIETNFGPGCNYDRVIMELRSEGLEVIDQRHSHAGSSPTGWTVKRDGSVDRGCEVVSPPLKFNEPEQRGQVERACRALQRAGCQPDESAGIHVHIGAQDLNPRQLANICRFFYKFEDIMFRIASSGWEKMRREAIIGTAYARPLPREMVEAMTRVYDMEALQEAWRLGNSGTWYSDSAMGNRYHAVNLSSWWIRGTVEFRLFNSSLNPERINAYIAICNAMVRDARRGQRRSINKSFPLGFMAENPEKQQPLLIRFQQVMTTTSGDGAKSRMRDQGRLMSKEDWKRVLMCWKDSRPQSYQLVRGY